VLPVGVLEGEGIGPSVVQAALVVLRAVASVSSFRIEEHLGSSIGTEAERETGEVLTSDVTKFCQSIFDRGGAVLAGAGGGRFVYEMRRQFDLFCKINPIVRSAALGRAGALRVSRTEGVDILVVRENSGGVYQGAWSDARSESGVRTAQHSFTYTDDQVRRVVRIAARLASERKGLLTLVGKPHGVPTISRLWIDCTREIARESAVRVRELEVDYAAYLLIQEPAQFDVIVTSNLFGDILSDLGGVLLGSRGLCYGASYSPTGQAVYQTNHGASLDLVGKDVANPVAQILSAAMMLRETFGRDTEADLIAAAVDEVWSQGIRTRDVATAGCDIVGTREMAERIAEAVVQLAGRST
jgi:3-isopropylmalate dehydrogenase